MSPARIRWLALAVALLVLLFSYLASYRTVVVMDGGEPRVVRSHAVTVGGALKAAGLELGPEDEVHPSRWALLHNNAIIELSRAAEVQLWADGQLYQATSTERQAGDLLAEFGIEVGADDSLVLAGQRFTLDEELPYTPRLIVELRRAVPVTLEDDGEEHEFQSSALTLGEALAEQGVGLVAADRLDPPAETPLGEGLTAVLQRAEPLEIEMAGETLTVRSAAGSVGSALAEAGLALQGLDYSLPAEDQPIPEDRHIKVVRVTESVEIDQQTIPFKTLYQDDPDTEFGTSSVIQLGQLGIQASRTRVRYEDGEEADRQEEATWQLAAPRDQINGYGTQVVVRTTVVDGVEIEYWATLNVYATSYSPCRSGVEPCLYGTSTSGVSVAKGVIATWKDWLLDARGVTVYVPGYGQGAFYDVGAYPEFRPWIDLGYSDDDWVGWSQWVTIYFTTPVPAHIPYFLYP